MKAVLYKPKRKANRELEYFDNAGATVLPFYFDPNEIRNNRKVQQPEDTVTM
ncbi:hypothetical protein F442_07265 [Phytophthora nicotianae P10297]|uniref:Uncharacterized protein n=1 Tax=Phytophthora nicotianae P10297 TaxID=1317064 RepID=W2ZJX8_PHYNI|nr:hypothetical protein F442_07265 [Phytophthora nicotianae P10297]